MAYRIDCLVPEKYPEDTNTVGSTFKETNESNSGWEAKLIQNIERKRKKSLQNKELCNFGYMSKKGLPWVLMWGKTSLDK